MSDSPYNRRATDFKKHDIEAMIAAEDDPKQRSFLIVLNSINNSLMANTTVTTNLSTQFGEHLERFEEKVAEDARLLNQGKGAWKVAAWVLGAAQSIVVALALFAAKDISSIHEELVAGKNTDMRIEARLEKLEARK